MLKPTLQPPCVLISYTLWLIWLWEMIKLLIQKPLFLDPALSQNMLFIDPIIKPPPLPLVYYSCYFVTYYPRWDYIFLDHPACSIETFHKTVQWAAKPFCIQQNTVSSARRMFPCCVPAEGTVTRGILLMIFTFAPKFPLWRGGTTCTLPDKSFLQGKEENSMALSLVYHPPYVWMHICMVYPLCPRSF